jgi:hypothetical protein
MTYQEVSSMVQSFDLPFAYYQFPEGTGQAPPFVVFFFSQIDDVYADDSNFQRIVVLNIELYTAEKDFQKESEIEAILKTNNFTYYKEENYLDSEKMWQIAYEMEVLING